MSYYVALQVSVVVLYSISFIASLVGNTLVLYGILKKPGARKHIGYLFVNLTVADLIITIVAIPESVAYYFRNGKWPGNEEGDFLCRIVHFSFALAIAASIFTLAAMTLNRFAMVVCPLRARAHNAQKKTTVVVIWLSSTVLMFHRLLTYSTSSDDCESDWSSMRIHHTTGQTISNVMYLVLLFILPLFFMTVLYTILCTKLCRQERPGIADLENVRRRRNRNRKVIKLLVSIVMVFVLCWVPAQAMHLLWALNKAAPEYVMFLFFWCGHSHSAINPWMYIYLNTKFRGSFLEIIGKLRN